MAPPFVSTSHIIYIDFHSKKIVGEQILTFDKMELVRDGRISYDRLLRRGHVIEVNQNAGQVRYSKEV